VVVYAQSNRDRKRLAKAIGVVMARWRSGGPASRRSTDRAGLALSRLARTQPAEPAPTMT
jgi:hypothetical protein